jgi:hypothetical protein
MGDWRSASRESANLAALPHLDSEAQVQIYVAKAFAWRGYLSVHSWMATKEKNADSYLVYHVLQWGLYYGSSTVVIEKDIPDRYWYGERPQMIFSTSGAKAEKMIPLIYSALNSYPYKDRYRIWPGPNSNSFISYIMRSVPGFNVSLPSNAIGKDWLCKSKFFSLSESRTGVQISILGLFGFTLGLIEGIEVNFLGLAFGIDIRRPALKFPILGRVGF